MKPKTGKRTRTNRTTRRRTVKSKRFRRLAAKRYSTSVRNVSRSIIPARYITKLMYSETFDLTQAANTPWNYSYSINGMNDPNLTGGGHQPMGFDQFAALYNNYYVTGMKIKLEGVCVSAGGFQISLGGLNNGLTPPNNADQLNESRFFYTKVVNNQRPWILKRYFGTAKTLGLLPDVMSKDENYWGLMAGTTNPNYGATAHIQVRNLDVSEQLIAQVTVTIVYYCVMFNPNEINQS